MRRKNRSVQRLSLQISLFHFFAMAYFIPSNIPRKGVQDSLLIHPQPILPLFNILHKNDAIDKIALKITRRMFQYML
jgi:hypothetical protein